MTTSNQPDTPQSPVPGGETQDLIAKLAARVKLLDGIIVEHHASHVARGWEGDTCPVCTEHGGGSLFGQTAALLRSAKASPTPSSPEVGGERMCRDAIPGGTTRIYCAKPAGHTDRHEAANGCWWPSASSTPVSAGREEPKCDICGGMASCWCTDDSLRHEIRRLRAQVAGSPSPVSSGGVPTIPTWEEVEAMLDGNRFIDGENRDGYVAGFTEDDYREVLALLRTLHTQALAGGEDTKRLDWLEESESYAAPFSDDDGDGWSVERDNDDGSVTLIGEPTLRKAIDAARTSCPTTEGEG